MSRLTELPLFQRKGSVVPQRDLDDEAILVLKTHDNGSNHHGSVYDDDGISMKAELDGDYFELSTLTDYETAVASAFTVRVEHAAWQLAWTRVRWEFSGGSVEQWETVTCGGVVLARVDA